MKPTDPHAKLVLPPPDRPTWLTKQQRAMFVLNCIVCALLMLLVLWLTPGCYFESEGTAHITVGDPDHYRPPHPDGYPSHRPNDIGSFGSSSEADGTGDATTLEPGTSSDEGTDGNPTTDGSSEGGSSSTGENPEVEATHCGDGCVQDDNVHDESGTACVCAPDCSTDEQCTAPSSCYYGRCVVPDCTDPVTQCPSPEMVCGMWTMFHTICFWPGEG